jgi:catechol 2,3-dioxygenase-like lactoylglutathione lyase family enzyme
VLNTETIIHPKLHHIGLLTGNLQPMLDWYTAVLGMRIIHESDNPTGAPTGKRPPIRAAFLSNDDASHRIAMFEVSGLAADPDHARHRRLQHIAFEFRTLDELLGTYLRLKALGIVPVFPVDEGAQIAFYYSDPDGNIVEINVCNFADRRAAIEHIQTSPDFARNPLGVQIDPDRMAAAHEVGATAWELHTRAWKGEFAPEKPYNPMALM